MPSQHTSVEAIWSSHLRRFPSAGPLFLFKREHYTDREPGDIYVSPQGRRHCRRCINRNVKAFYAREKNNRARKAG